MIRRWTRFVVAVAMGLALWLAAPDARASAPMCDHRGASADAPPPLLETPQSSVDIRSAVDAAGDLGALYTAVGPDGSHPLSAACTGTAFSSSMGGQHHAHRGGSHASPGADLAPCSLAAAVFLLPCPNAARGDGAVFARTARGRERLARSAAAMPAPRRPLVRRSARWRSWGAFAPDRDRS